MTLNKNQFIIFNEFFKENEEFNINDWSNKDFQIGRQDRGLYLKSTLHDLPDFVLDKIYQITPETPELFMDSWHLVVQSDIPEHSDPGLISLRYGCQYDHLRLNIILDDWIGFNIGKTSTLLNAGSAILFRADAPHSTFSEYGKPINILSFGFMMLPKLTFECKI
jgi:hypothetical protein